MRSGIWIDRIEPAVAQEAREHRRRGRAVDVVVAEDRDRLAALDGVGEARRRRRHAGERVGIGHQARARSDRERPPTSSASTPRPASTRASSSGSAVALRDRERARVRALVEPVAPGAARSPSARRRERWRRVGRGRFGHRRVVITDSFVRDESMRRMKRP